MIHQQEIKLFLSESSPCNYLPGLKQTSIVVDPQLPITSTLYDLLASNGFRRSGDLVYRPHCEHCQACIPIRIPVNKLSLSRSQRRNLKLNSDLSVTHHPASFSNEHFELYGKYQSHRHPDSSMSNSDPEEYLNFLTSRDIDTVFYEFRLKQKLVAIAVTDILESGLSAVYTFYDPSLASRGLGTYAILWQCQQAKHLKLPWLYLGFWIAECQKMSYKVKFQPCEGFHNSSWQPI